LSKAGQIQEMLFKKSLNNRLDYKEEFKVECRCRYYNFISDTLKTRLLKEVERYD
jgi:hypothetical protein